MSKSALLGLALLLGSSCSSSEVSRTLGAQCESRSECDDRCVSGGDYPQGLCTTSCETDLDCPSFARCMDLEGGICLYRCDAPDDCSFLGQGWTCASKDRREQVEEATVCFGE